MSNTTKYWCSTCNTWAWHDISQGDAECLACHRQSKVHTLEAYNPQRCFCTAKAYCAYCRGDQNRKKPPTAEDRFMKSIHDLCR